MYELLPDEPQPEPKPSTEHHAQLIEPGIMQVLRWSTTALWLIYALGVCETVGQNPPDLFIVLNFVFFSLLMLILFWRRLQVRLGGRFLPIALIIVSAGPILGDAAATWLYAYNRIPLNETDLDPSRLHIWLILPLLLVSLQYSMKTVAAFTVATVVLPIILAIPPVQFYDNAVRQHSRQGVVRLILYLLVGFIISRITSQQREQRQELAIKNAELTKLTTSMEELTITR